MTIFFGVKFKMQNEWEILKSRYASNMRYLNRKVLKSASDFEDFTNFIVDLGAEILTGLKQDECLRFKYNGHLGIMWGKGSGNLLAHNLGVRYYRENGEGHFPEDFSLNANFRLPIKFSSRPLNQTKGMQPATPYQWCAGCKEVEPHNLDGSCTVCGFYSNHF